MSVLNPLDLFRNADGVPEHFDGKKQVIFIDWDANPPQFETQLVPPPTDKPSMSASVWPGDGMAFAITFHWRFLIGRTVPCNGSAQTFEKTYRKGLQAALSVSLQRELEQKLEVSGVGGISSKVTASIGMTFTATYEEETKETVTISPPATGSVTKEFYQPIVVTRIITPGKVYELENGLSHILERTEETDDPVCGADEPGHGHYKPGTGLLEGYALAEVPGMDATALERLGLLGVTSPLQLARLSPRKLMLAGIEGVQAKKIYTAVSIRLQQEIKKIYPAG